VREPIVPQLAEREFLSWEAAQDAKFELHRGFVMAFAGGTADHNTIAFNLHAALDRLFPAPCRTFGSGMKVRVATDTFYYPDTSVICVEVPGDATVIDQPQIVSTSCRASLRAQAITGIRASTSTRSWSSRGNSVTSAATFGRT
jgi:hypothetical protein